MLALAGRPLAGTVPGGLYHLFGLAAFGGWMAGNVYVARSRGRPRLVRRYLLPIWLVGPPAPLYLVHTLLPPGIHTFAPFSALYALAVFLILFAVPVSFRPRSPR